MSDGGRISDAPRWWTMRRAHSSKPATYRCPFCDERLHAMSEHVVIAPEGNVDRRRHAHTHCVAAAHGRGELPTYDDWRAAQPRRPGLLGRLLRRPTPEQDAAGDQPSRQSSASIE